MQIRHACKSSMNVNQSSMQKTHLCKSSMHANHRMHENHQIRKECTQRRKYNKKYLMGGSRRNEMKKKEKVNGD